MLFLHCHRNKSQDFLKSKPQTTATKDSLSWPVFTVLLVSSNAPTSLKLGYQYYRNSSYRKTRTPHHLMRTSPTSAQPNGPDIPSGPSMDETSRWEYCFSRGDQSEMKIYTEKDVDSSRFRRVKQSVVFAANEIRAQFGPKRPTMCNLLQLS